MKPKFIPKQARKWIEQLFCRLEVLRFCWLQVLRQLFMFLSCCIYLDAFSFMFLSFTCIFLSLCIHFLSLSVSLMFLSLVFISIHVPFMFLSISFQCAFVSSHLPFTCTHFPFVLHSCPFMSFPNLKLWKWRHGLAKKLTATNGYRAKLSQRLLLNNPSNM